MNNIKHLVITMGCPAGVGPEIIVKALASRSDWLDPAKVVVVGDRAILERAMGTTGSPIAITRWNPEETPERGKLNLLEATSLKGEEVPWGTPTPVTGLSSYEYVIRAIELCKNGLCSGVATAPISKIGLRYAGIGYPGHTEILADKTGTERFSMMMTGPRLKVMLATIHEPLRMVAQMITRSLILEKLELLHHALQNDFGISRPKIAVAGLNPHAGEAGTIGTEERDTICPAIDEARSKGIDVSGPHPPDTVFFHACQGEFDAVLCMYHDQGLIPFKMLNFWDGVNVTTGLPIVRTSVDHGTAYDIAGTGTANPKSLIHAVETAFQIIENRLRCRPLST